MFESLLQRLNEQGGGVRAYEACAREARSRIAAEPENAAALFLIFVAAQRFVDSYDDQPLTVEAAGAELEKVKSFVAVLERAFGGVSDEEKVAALNDVATRLAEPKS